MARGDAKKLSYANDYSDKEIWLYKAGSFGEVVGIYKSAKDIEEVEKMFNPNFSSASIYLCINGGTKYFRSYNHQCKVKPVLKPKR
jgi:hypothetical protein